MSENVKFDTYAACVTLAETLHKYHTEDSEPCLIMAVNGKKDGRIVNCFSGMGAHQMMFFWSYGKEYI